jgi:hypothetical protein
MVSTDIHKPDPWDEMFRTDDVLPPQVVAFVNEVMETKTTREDAWGIHHLLKGQRLKLTPGWTLDVLYGVSIYTELPIPEAHDHPVIRDFVQKVAKAIEVFERWEAERETERQAEKVMEQARERISAGQKEMSSSRGLFTAGQNALTCKNDLKAKLVAEAHKDPRSQDWKDAPRSAWPSYEWLMTTLIGGGHVREILPSLDPDGGALAWLVSEGLVAEVDGELVALPDPEPYYDPDERFMHWGGKDVDLWEYPGWTREMGNPLAGKTWGRDLDEDVRALALREKAAGHDLSPRQIAEKLQTSVDLGEHRAISVKAVQRALKRLVDEGKLVQLTYADRFRKAHRWVNIPATYADPAEVLTMRGVRDRLRRKRDAAEVGLAA